MWNGTGERKYSYRCVAYYPSSRVSSLPKRRLPHIQVERGRFATTVSEWTFFLMTQTKLASVGFVTAGNCVQRQVLDDAKSLPNCRQVAVRNNMRLSLATTVIEWTFSLMTQTKLASVGFVAAGNCVRRQVLDDAKSLPNCRQVAVRNNMRLSFATTVSEWTLFLMTQTKLASVGFVAAGNCVRRQVLDDAKSLPNCRQSAVRNNMRLSFATTVIEWTFSLMTQTKLASVGFVAAGNCVRRQVLDDAKSLPNCGRLQYATTCDSSHAPNN